MYYVTALNQVRKTKTRELQLREPLNPTRDGVKKDNFNMIASSKIFDKVAEKTLGWPSSRRWDSKDKDRRIRAFFGAPTSIISNIWNLVWVKLSKQESDSIIDDGVQFKYLLYALVFMKVYSTEEVHCSIVDWPSTKTFRKWSWYFVKKISELKSDFIDIKNRFLGLKKTVTTNCFISIDCVDCPIFEPWPFDRKWFSQKTNGPALKYEVAVCIKTGFIVWINGPFQASKNDATVFKEGLSKVLAPDEAVEADNVYAIKEDCVASRQLKTAESAWTSKEKYSKSCVRARNERVNGKLKVFNVLTTYFRHTKPRKEMMIKHGICFTAIAVITQLKMEAGEVVEDGNKYDVNYF